MAIPSVRVTQKDTYESGRPGTRIFSGYIQTDEYLSVLTGTAKYDKYEEMKWSDPLIAGLLNTIKQPIMASEWYIEPPGNESKDAERTQFIHKNLLENGLFHRSLPELLESLDNGFSPLEMVYELVGKTLWLKKLAHRAPRTITGWFSDPAMRVITEVEQDPGIGINSKVRIPARKMIVLTHQPSGLNMEGVSILRPMYKPWYYKQGVEQVLAVYIERMTGIPYANYDKNKIAPDDITALEEKLKFLVNHEQAYIALENTIELSLLQGEGNQTPDLIEYFRYQDQAMAISALAQFAAAIGSGTSGISETKPLMDLFLAAQQALVKKVEDGFNHSDPRLKDQIAPIEKLIRYNYGPKVPIPKLRCSKVASMNLDTLGKNTKELMIAGAIEPDDRIEDLIRRVSGLPPKDPATTRKQTATGTNMIDNAQPGAANIKTRT